MKCECEWWRIKGHHITQINLLWQLQRFKIVWGGAPDFFILRGKDPSTNRYCEWVCEATKKNFVRGLQRALEVKHNASRCHQITSDDIIWHYVTQDDKKWIECWIHLQELIRRCPKFPGRKAQRPPQDLQLVRRKILRHPEVSCQGSRLPFWRPFSTRVWPDKLGIHQLSVHR